MRLECVEGGSRKFWEARLDGTTLHVRWGRIGTDGQSKAHSFASLEAATNERDKLVREKTRKGYVVVEEDAKAPPVAPSAPAAEASPAMSPPQTPAAAPTLVAAAVAADASPASSKPTKRSPAEARTVAGSLEPTSRNAHGVTTWSLFRGEGNAREFVEVSVAGNEIEVARGKVGLTGRVRSVALAEGESVDARVRRELAKALADGFDPGGAVAPTPEFEDAEAKHRRRAAAFLEKHARVGFFPELEPGAGDLLDSRFGGLPALDASEHAPACRACSKPMSLLVQLRHDALPAEARKLFAPALVQLFWCDTICTADAVGWDPFSPAHHARAIPLPASPRWPREDERAERVYAPLRITSWSERMTEPCYEDIREIVGDNEPDFVEWLVEDDDSSDAKKKQRGGVQLLGWPYWLQSKVNARCRACGTLMTAALQIDTARPLKEVGFGDSGISWLLVCSRCHAMTFAWQSC